MDNQQHIDALDGLRGLAALIVAVSHFTNETDFLDGILGHGAGQIGVMIFFALSGFLMAHLYMQRELRSITLLLFFSRRIARVVPLYFLVVISSYCLWRLRGEAWPLFPVTSESLIENLFFLKGVSILWTIAVEFQFYIFFPLIWFLGRKSKTIILVITIIYVFLISLAGYPKEPVLLRSVPFFMAGVFISTIPNLNNKNISNAIFVICLIATIISFPRIITPIEFHLGLTADPIKYVIVWESKFYLILIPSLVWSALSAPWAKLLLGHQSVRYLGTISYSFYLIHMPILELMEYKYSIKNNVFLFLVIYVSITIALSVISYVFIERPSGQAIRYITGRKWWISAS